MKSRYFGKRVCTAAWSVGQFVVAAHVFAGDELLVITRDVPYQSASGPRHTGQVSGVDVAPDTQVKAVPNAASTINTGALTELTDHESSVIAGRVHGHMNTMTATLQVAPGQAGAASGKWVPATGIAFAATGGLAPLATGMGAHAGGSVGRATGALANTLTGVLPLPVGGNR